MFAGDHEAPHFGTAAGLPHPYRPTFRGPGRAGGMRRDFQFAPLLAASGVPLGMALIAAPEYLHSSGDYLAIFGGRRITRGGGLIAAAFIIAWRGEAADPHAGYGRRMTAPAGMAVCAIGFVLFAGYYLWTRRQTPITPLHLAPTVTLLGTAATTRQRPGLHKPEHCLPYA